MKLILFLSLLIACFTTAAQGSYKQTLYAYTEKHASVNTYFIYIELSPGQNPIWDSAVINGKMYLVHASLIETIPLQVGERKKDGRMVVIKPKPGNKLWKLDFDLIEAGENQTALSPSADVVLKGLFKTHRITRTITDAVELAQH